MAAGPEPLFALAGLTAALLIARHALRGGRVDAERIFAALDAYLLAAFVFGVAYWVLDRQWPGSFGVGAEGPLDPQRAVYLSFVVISTLGFGGCVVVISHDRWFLDRLATHMLAFEGDSHVEWFEGNYQDYEADRHRRLGAEADQPHRIKYRKLVS